MRKNLVLLLLSLFVPMLINSCNLKTNAKKNISSAKAKSAKTQQVLKKILTKEDIIKWDLKRYCPSYILIGKLNATYFDPKSRKRINFIGSLYINYNKNNFKVSIYDRYNQKIFEKNIKGKRFAFCINRGTCINISYQDLIGYLDLKNIQKPKLIDNSLIGFKNGKIIIANYPTDAQVKNLDEVISYYYDKTGYVKQINIKLTRLGNIKINVKKLICANPSK